MKAQHSVFTFPETVNPDWRIGLVPALYHRRLVEAMVEGAIEAFIEAGIKRENITTHPVLGTFEVPLIGSAVAKAGNVDALIGFGIVLEGETAHADHITREAARGMMDVQVQLGVPFAFEILQVKDLKLAEARCFGDDNKGREAAVAVLHSLAELQKLGS